MTYVQEEDFDKALNMMRSIQRDMAFTLTRLGMGASTSVWDNAFNSAANDVSEAFRSTIHFLDDARLGSEDI
jgi:hypothetical protein